MPPLAARGGQTGPRLRSDRIVSAAHPSSPPTTGGADYRGMPHPYYLSWHPKKKVLSVPPGCRSIHHIFVFVRAPGYRRAWSYGTLPAANRTFQSWFAAQGTPTSSRVASRECCQHQPRSPRKDVSCGTRCSNTMLGPGGSHRFVWAGSSGFPPGGGPRLQWGGPALNPSVTLLNPLGYPGGSHRGPDRWAAYSAHRPGPLVE